jgi:hypothetical protein
MSWLTKFLWRKRHRIYIYVLLVFNEKSLKIPKEVIRIRIPKKNKQHNDQNKKYNGTNNDLQNIYKTKDRVTRRETREKAQDTITQS